MCREKVTITYDKTCIFLDGAGSRETFIEWDGHESTNTSATFTSYAENLVVKGIGFKVIKDNNSNNSLFLEQPKLFGFGFGSTAEVEIFLGVKVYIYIY